MIRTDQVGLGAWGTDWAVRVLPEAPELAAVGFVDTDPLRRAEFTALTGAPASAAVDWSADFDAVLVTTSLGAHGPLARTALEAGRHVLLEKPFTLDPAEAVELVELAESRGLVLLVSQNHRFFPAVAVAKEALAHVGQVRNARVSFRRDHRFQALGPSPDTSVLHQLAAHHFDLVRHLLAEVVAVTAHRWRRGQDPDALLSSFSATLELVGGALVEYSASTSSQATTTPWSGEWVIEGDGGAVEWSGESLVNLSRVTVHRAGLPPETVPVDAPPSKAGVGDRVAVVRDFADAVHEGRASSLSGRANLGTVAVLLAAWDSLERGGARVEVRVPGTG